MLSSCTSHQSHFSMSRSSRTKPWYALSYLRNWFKNYGTKFLTCSSFCTSRGPILASWCLLVLSSSLSPSFFITMLSSGPTLYPSSYIAYSHSFFWQLKPSLSSSSTFLTSDFHWYWSYLIHLYVVLQRWRRLGSLCPICLLHNVNRNVYRRTLCCIFHQLLWTLHRKYNIKFRWMGSIFKCYHQCA